MEAINKMMEMYQRLQNENLQIEDLTIKVGKLDNGTLIELTSSSPDGQKFSRLISEIMSEITKLAAGNTAIYYGEEDLRSDVPELEDK